MDQTALTVLFSTDGVETELEFSLNDLDAMPQHTILTENEFVDGMNTFTGPLARLLIEETDNRSSNRVKLTAANQYHIEVPVKDFFDYDVILATRQNGQLFSRRDKGPIWLIYPMSEHAELRDSTYNARLIWQLIHMEVLPN